VPDFDLSFINEQQEGELFEAVGRVAEALLAARGANYDVVPVYKRVAIRDGQTKAYIAALETIPVVIEEHLSYEQVAEFRRDHEACGNYRALRAWLRDGLAARGIEEAKEIIERKIEDYTKSIQKHGLETARDYIQIVYDDKFIKRLLALTSGAAVLTGCGKSRLRGKAKQDIAY
jgi:hypothetical protein